MVLQRLEAASDREAYDLRWHPHVAALPPIERQGESVVASPAHRSAGGRVPGSAVGDLGRGDCQECQPGENTRRRP
jgi:hypothetical protein